MPVTRVWREAGTPQQTPPTARRTRRDRSPSRTGRRARRHPRQPAHPQPSSLRRVPSTATPVADELDGDDDADGHAGDGSVEAQVHQNRVTPRAASGSRWPWAGAAERARPDGDEEQAANAVRSQSASHADSIRYGHREGRSRLDGEREDHDKGRRRRRVAAATLAPWLGLFQIRHTPMSLLTAAPRAHPRGAARQRHTRLVSRLRSWYFSRSPVYGPKQSTSPTARTT